MTTLVEVVARALIDVLPSRRLDEDDTQALAAAAIKAIDATPGWTVMRVLEPRELSIEDWEALRMGGDR